MAFLSVGCVIAIDTREDCAILKIEDGLLNIKTLILRFPCNALPKMGDCIAYTTSTDERRVLEFGKVR
jgi:hypothetical protein